MRTLRKQRKWSLAQLAGASGMDVSQLSKVERGTCATSPEGYERIARALGVSIASLFAVRRSAA